MTPASHRLASRFAHAVATARAELESSITAVGFETIHAVGMFGTRIGNQSLNLNGRGLLAAFDRMAVIDPRRAIADARKLAEALRDVAAEMRRNPTAKWTSKLEHLGEEVSKVIDPDHPRYGTRGIIYDDEPVNGQIPIVTLEGETIWAASYQIECSFCF